MHNVVQAFQNCIKIGFEGAALDDSLGYKCAAHLNVPRKDWNARNGKEQAIRDARRLLRLTPKGQRKSEDNSWRGGEAREHRSL